MSDLLRSVGEAFGIGDPKVDQDALMLERRRALKAREDQLDLEGQAQASRIRSANGGRRAALASRVRDTMG